MTLVPKSSLAGPMPMTAGAFVAPLTTLCIWSGNAIVTKAAATVIAPSSIAFYRWSLAFLILLPFASRAAWRRRDLVARYGLKLAVLGLLGMVIYQSLAYQAAKTIDAVNMGVILALTPLISTFLASVLAGERMSRARLGGAAISLTGLAYLISQGRPATLLAGGFHVGDGLMLIAVTANGLYGVLLKRWAMPLPTWLQLFSQIAVATLVLLPIWLLGPMSPVTSANLPLILYAAIPTSLLAPFCWIIGIRRIGAARTAMFINLLPLVVAALAWGILGEELHVYHAIGGGLALLGVAIGLREPKIAERPRDRPISPAACTIEDL